jgi:SAM-dependent methyltransferase
MVKKFSPRLSGLALPWKRLLVHAKQFQKEPQQNAPSYLMDFSNRSYEKELLDRNDIPFEDIKQNMKELDYINARLGGHKITLEGVRTIIRGIENRSTGNMATISILEIGCGGGDNLRVIKAFCGDRNIDVGLSGVDINPHCIEFAKSREENEGIRFYATDYKLFKLEEKPAIIFCSLFCHHFTDAELIDILKWMKENSSVGFFINDLHRHPLAYYSIKWLTKFFSKSYLVKNDAPLSVLRGFKRKELKMFHTQCSIVTAQIKWKWAFRWLIVVQHKN